MLRAFGPLSIINAAGDNAAGDIEHYLMVVDFERGELLRYRHARGDLCPDLGVWRFDRSCSPTRHRSHFAISVERCAFIECRSLTIC
ncbi:MAG TPA: hypothetical protein VEX18_04695 [Polyangiaceae bacterium]|nr:hypothetical protein [Polyangiaceae bacterium]